jgi:D-aminoacyl-tRNA deacylase
MRALLQRVTSAAVRVDGEVVGQIDREGLLVLLGVTHGDTTEEAVRLAHKTWTLRILADERSCEQQRAPLLVVSQFTLYADARKGRRPSWSAAAPRELSEPLVESFVSRLRDHGAEVATGRFGATMEVALVNSGPVTVLLDSADLGPVAPSSAGGGGCLRESR